jgi:hypothetical protein
MTGITNEEEEKLLVEEVIKSMLEALAGIMGLKESAVADIDFEKAAKYRDDGDALKKLIAKLEEPLKRRDPWPPAKKIKHMYAREMTSGRQYKLLGNYRRENGAQKVVEFDRASFDNRLYLVHPRGDLDMQSMSGLEPDAEVQIVSETSTDGLCPACGAKVEPTCNPDNPVCRQHKHMCDCGWMGD